YLLPVFTVFYVVSDLQFDLLQRHEQLKTFHAFDADDWRSTKEIGKRLSEQLGRSGDYDFSSLAYELHTMNQGYGAVLFIGFFIGAVFFVAAGSFLYFRLYADLDGDKRKFAMLAKLGITDQELAKVITRQLAILFFVPIGVAVVHGAVALTSLQNMFQYSLV